MSARGWSAAGTGEGDARAEAVGVEPFDASPTANFARNRSSSVVRPVGRGLGAGDAVRSAAGGEVEGVCVWPTPGLAGRCATKVFLRLLNADSARCDEDERDDRMPSIEERAGASSPLVLDASWELLGDWARLSTVCLQLLNIAVGSRR